MCYSANNCFRHTLHNQPVSVRPAMYGSSKTNAAALDLLRSSGVYTVPSARSWRKMLAMPRFLLRLCGILIQWWAMILFLNAIEPYSYGAQIIWMVLPFTIVLPYHHYHLNVKNIQRIQPIVPRYLLFWRFIIFLIPYVRPSEKLHTSSWTRSQVIWFNAADNEFHW